MFSKLVASGPQRRGSWTPGAVSVSVAVHLLLLAGGVYASVRPPVEAEEAEEEITFLEIEETAPEPPAPPDPAPPPPTPVVPPPPQGFQELIPPIDPPPIIPLADLDQPAVDISDFSGIGVAGGTARGVEGGTPQNTAVADSTFAYEVAVLDSPPRLANGRQVQSLLGRLYPRILLDAGINGSVTVQFVVEPDGSVDRSSVKVVSSTHEQFTGASIEAIERFEFEPGRYKGQSVRVVIQMPITWQSTS